MDIGAFQRYLHAKREQWQIKALPGEPSLTQYISNRGRQSLAQEFAADDVFVSGEICKFLASDSGKWATAAAKVVIAPYDPEAGVVATIIVAAMSDACAASKMKGLVGPIAIIGGLTIVGLILWAIFGGGDDEDEEKKKPKKQSAKSARTGQTRKR